LQSGKPSVVAGLIEAAGAKVVFLSPYSPNLSPIKRRRIKSQAQIVILPMLLIYIFFGGYFIQGILFTGSKG